MSPQGVNPVKNPKRRCHQCKTPIVAIRENQRFCSKQCRMRWHAELRKSAFDIVDKLRNVTAEE